VLARVPFPNTVASVQGFLAGLEHGNEVAFAGFHQGALVGLASYHGPEVGYWIGRPFWGRGFATQMARAVVHHAFTATDRALLTTSHFADNPASGRVIAKCGFTESGRGSVHSVARGAEVPSLKFELARANAEALPWFASAVRPGNSAGPAP
jgi:[ribosomal protein S5]-alanine N-acetyltransferase